MNPSENATAYAVEISAAAWKQLSRLPLETYQRIREELDTVATRLVNVGTRTLARLKSVCQGTSLSLEVGDYVVLYDVDPERRHLALREIARRHPRDT
jgi:mRNA-degrading endonuclease RelE of RelBE toxin-antitoxin system